MFSSCLSTDEDCPVDTRLHFELDDQYDINGTFDSSIGNDVLLYVFKDKVLTRIETISYSDIQSYGRAGVPFRQDEKTSGNLEFIAWSTPAATQADLPQWLEGRTHDALVLELDAGTREGEACQPASRGGCRGRSGKTRGR